MLLIKQANSHMEIGNPYSRAFGLIKLGLYHLNIVERNRSTREDLLLYLKCSGKQFYLRKSWHFHRRKRNRKVKNIFNRREKKNKGDASKLGIEELKEGKL